MQTVSGEDDAKANPEKPSNASSGNGTVSHLAMEEFKRQAGVKIVHVPDKGSAAGLTDVVAGNVSIVLNGKLRVLSSPYSKWLGGALDTPTLIEEGYADFNAATWLMFLCPSGTPKQIVQATFEQVNKIVRDPEIDQKLQGIGLLTRTSNSPGEAAAYMQQEYKKWGEIVTRSGATIG